MLKRLILLLLACSLAQATTYTVYMVPGGAGAKTGGTLANAADTFDALLSGQHAVGGNGDMFNVSMAYGTYSLSSYQTEFDNEGSTYLNGKTFNFNYTATGTTPNVTVAFGTTAFSFGNNSGTSPTTYNFNNIAFTATTPAAASIFYFAAAGGAGALANSNRNFNNCTISISGTGTVFRSSVNIAGEITLNNCTSSSIGSLFVATGSCSYTITGGSYQWQGASNLIDLSGTSTLTATNATFSDATFTSPYEGTTPYRAIVASGGTPSVYVNNCTVSMDPMGYGEGVRIGTPTKYAYIKHTNITAPNYGIVVMAAASNVIIDGADSSGNRATVDAKAPSRYTFMGTWHPGDAITIWVRRGQQVAQFNYAIAVDGWTDTQIAGSVATAWASIANVPLLQSITATSSGATLILNGTSSWSTMHAIVTRNGTVVPPDGIPASPQLYNAAVHDSTYVSVPIPASAIDIQGYSITIKNLNVRNSNGMAWEGISLESTAASGRTGNITYNCDVRDAWFPIICRSAGETIENCIMVGPWTALVESSSYNCTWKYNTMYALGDPTDNTGGIIWATGGVTVAANNQFCNNIVVADGTLINVGNGNNPTTSIYCLFDHEALGQNGNYFDHNCYWATGGAKLANINGTEYTTQSGLMGEWAADTTRSMINDSGSIVANPNLDNSYKITTASPCYKAGEKDVTGHATTIGAYTPAGSTGLRGRRF